MILYRPVGLQELALIYDSGMQAFPARLPQQPIFYPVLQLEYARQTASGWNAQNGQFAGYITQFKVEDEYISQFEEHTVGGSQYQELWIPAEAVEEFNKHIIGHIKVVEAHFGNAFQGFVPEKFGLQGKNAVEQFTMLANSYIYKRMDFYLEIKRNHKAVFLNFPFWQKHEFKNPGLKEKVLQAIKEAWLTSFPKIPLPLPPPVREDTPLITDTHADSLVDPDQEDITPVEDTDADSWEEPVQEDTPRIKQTHSRSLVNPDRDDPSDIEQSDSDFLDKTVHENMKPVEQTEVEASLDPVQEDRMPARRTGSHILGKPVREEITLPAQTDPHFVQGIQLGLSGRYQEAIGELFKAIEKDPDNVVAQTSLGVAFHRVGDDDRALACYETALRIDPIYDEAHYFRSNILYNQGDVREAIAGYTIAIGLKPELIEAHQEPAPQDRLTDYSPAPAEMYWIAKPARRILDLNKSLESNPEQANLFKARAAEYSRLRNYVQAIADYSASLMIEPDDASVLHVRGLTYEQLGQSDRALEDYQRAFTISPQLSNVYINRGITFGNMGNFRQSIASFTEAIRLAPGNPDGYFNRGTAYLQQGDIEKAIDDFSNVIRLSPRDETAYYRRGISNEEAGRQQEAIADYRQFLALSQDPKARQEIEQKLSQWSAGKRDSASRRSAPDDRQKTNPNPSPLRQPDPDFDLHSLILTLGKRALDSTWFGSGVDCSGEKAEELYSLTDQGSPIEGGDLLSITSGIRRTIAGDFYAVDPEATSHWIFIRAWEGSGFYIETSDRKIKERLKTHFQSAEEVDGASPPYEGLFIHV